MITPKTGSFRELSGEYEAVISSILCENNPWYKEEYENSTKEQLTIDFILEDPETAQNIEYTQKFIAPLLGGTFLFQQLLDAAGLASEEGTPIDEQQLVGAKMVVTFGKRKDKNGKEWDTIREARASGSTAPKKAEQVTQEQAGAVFGS